MSAKIIELRSPIRPIAQFIRVGDIHKKLGDLHAAGQLPLTRAVFDASRFPWQKEFVRALQRENVEIVLDPEIAELAARQKFNGQVRRAPWSGNGSGHPLGPNDFGPTKVNDLVAQIARFAVINGVTTVLSPTHFLADPDYGDWLNLDVNACIELRNALDREGGRTIAIDYPVLHSHVGLNDSGERSKILSSLSDLPIDNVWIRPSGLGHDPKPLTTKQFLGAMHGLHNLGKPVIIDHLDGLLGQAVLAFGAASGLAHGIAERNQFDARSWHKDPPPRDESSGFGRKTYISIPGLGRTVSKQELEYLASARGGKSVVGCQDTCCAHGVVDMLNDPRRHAARQEFACVEALSKVPDLSREQFFLDKPMRDAERVSRTVKDLKPSQKEAERLMVDWESLDDRLKEHHKKIGKLSDALTHLHDTRGNDAPRAKPCASRVQFASPLRREQR
jgi:hypothetical protein